MQKRLSPSIAARLLRAIPSELRSQQSRLNGRKGGRPPSGVCPERELRRRVRSLLRGKVPNHEIATWQDWACSLRSEIIRGVRDVNCCYDISLHSASYYERMVSRLIPECPLLL